MSNSQTNNNIGPLKGVRAIGLATLGAGPLSMMILADMGAEVIKIEEPRRGDPSRQMTPLVDDIGGLFPYFNRNQKSITLNLKTEKGKQILRRLIKWTDVLEENYRPGVMKRLGFDYPVVREINPRVVMLSISGYGQTGPDAQRPVFDAIAQARSGIQSLTGDTDGPPMPIGRPISDFTTGLFGALGIMLALYNRFSTGLGQHVESTFVESMVFLMGDALVRYVRGGANERGIPYGPTGTFQSKDGLYVTIVAIADNYWPLMADIMGRSDLANTPGYSTQAERAVRALELKGIMAEWVASNNIDEVETALNKAGIPFSRVQTLADVLKDTQLNARGLFKQVDHYGETLPIFGPYPILSDTPGTIRTPCPHLGQHNEEIYCGMLGYSHQDLELFKSEGVI